MRRRAFPVFLLVCVLLLLLAGCGGGEASERRTGPPGDGAGQSKDEGGESRKARRGGPGGRPGGPPGGPGGPGADAPRGVPVEVAVVDRRPMALFFETQGTLEAENEVDLVARVAGLMEEIRAEQGDRVEKGELLARIDDREIRTQLDVLEVRLAEAKQSYERVRRLHEQELVSRDAFDAALAAYEAARGEVERLKVQLEYTRIAAPFGGRISERYVKPAELVQNGSRLFHLVDFDPLLAPIRVPEREIDRLYVGQPAAVEVEAYGDRRFGAEVLRLSPVVDAATGTVEVTLEVDGDGLLRPGMFATVYLEMDRRGEALVVPKAALALDSLGSTVYVVEEGEDDGADGAAADVATAERRELEVGFRNEDFLEVLGGVEAGEKVVVVGQDGLADGTPVEVLETLTVDMLPLEGEPLAEESATDG